MRDIEELMEYPICNICGIEIDLQESPLCDNCGDRLPEDWFDDDY